MLAEGPARGVAAYRPDIDGLRAFAVLAVIVHHFNRDLLPSGFLGVDIFFVISGYVISGSLAAHGGANLSGFLRDFYVRRVKRILPALIACVLLTGVLVLAVDASPMSSLSTGGAALFGISNITLALEETDYFSRSTDLNAFAQTWSLGVEEQFYLVFPVLFWIGLRSRWAGTRIYPVAMLLLSAASLAAFVVGTNSPAAKLTYFSMPARFWELAAGALLYEWMSSRKQGAVEAPLPLAPVFLGAALALLFAPRDQQALVTISVVGTTLGLMASVHPGGKTYSVLSHPAVVYVGNISYSLYLWHWSVLSLSRWVVGVHPWTVPFQILAIFGLSVLSYTLIERPLRHAPWGGMKWRTVGAGLAASGVCATLLLGLLVARNTLGIETLGARNIPAAFVALAGSDGSDCVVDAKKRPLTADMFERCTVPPTAAGLPTIWTLGDSHAGHLRGLLRSLHKRTGVGVHLIETVDVAFPMTRGNEFEPRQRIYNEILNRLQPGDILLVSRLMLNRQGEHAPLPGLNRWVDDVGALAQQVAVRGAKVVVMGPPPMFGFDVINACVLLSPCEVNREQLAGHVDEVLGMLRPAAAAHDNLFVYDSFEVLCPPAQDVCSPKRNGLALFRDRDHLNAVGAAALADDFTSFLGKNRLLVAGQSDEL